MASWPASPIAFVSHGGPGSGPHLMLTALAASFVEAGCPDEPTLETLPDQDGADAIRRVAHSGTASLVGSCTPTYLTTPLVHNMPETYNTLTPIAGLVADTYVLAVAATNPAATAAELFAGATIAGAPKAGGNTDIQAMLLRDVVPGAIEVAIIHDQPDILAALASGAIDWTTGVFSDFAAAIAEGTVRLLAAFDDETSPQGLAPTLVGQGINVTFPLWRGLIASGDTTAEAAAAWDAALRVAVTQPSWTAYLDKERQRLSYLDPAGFTALLDSENLGYSSWVGGLGA